MLNIKKLIEATEDMPEDWRENILLLVKAINESGDVEGIAEGLARGLVRGAMQQLREELGVGESAKKARNIES